MFSELSGLSESVQTLTNDSVEYSSSISKMTSELESAQALLKALSNDIDAIKKRQADIAKGAWEPIRAPRAKNWSTKSPTRPNLTFFNDESSVNN